ncbi:HEAT repeat-containing protein 1-like [Amphibalanus amphitrite]|uniref:HEAT repeat-containing protein 1-like n=1 Tax=Amphibalanus amphitrite TaxID=1232801 RepID=UPI001C909D66|nr:HEAT repeat-containing protein 1-like [Amphibalanus amphitrite]
MVLTAALTVLLLLAAVELFRTGRDPTLDSEAFGPAGAATCEDSGTLSCTAAHQLWAAGGRRQRLLKRAGCGWWLLLLLSLSGNIEHNPGPALRLYSQNVNSLKGKLGTLRTHAGELAEFDALCFVETKMAPSLPTDSELQLGLEGFTWFRRDRTANGGGVACAVKASLSPVHRPDLETDCESLVVQLGSGRAAYLAICYRPPSQNEATQKIADLLRGLHATGHPFLLTGDLNLPELTWEDGEPTYRSRTARAELFIDALTTCEAEQSVTAPTRGGNFLDLVVTRGGAAHSRVRDKIFDADHEAVETRFTVDLGVPPRVTRTKVYNYKRAEFAALRQSLRLLPWSVLDQLLLLSAVTLTLKLTEALAHFISPYVADLVAHVSRLSAAHGTDGAGVLSHRLSQTRRRLATGVPLRVLLPAVDQCFGRLVADGAADALAALMPVLSDAARSADVAELSAALPSLQALIVRALEFRAAGGARPATARRVEAAVLEAVTCVVPRLSEATFGPLLVRLLDWASGAGAPTARLVTFFRLTDALAGRLQGLFVLFAGHLVRPLAAALSGASSLSERPLLPGDEEGSCELAEYALDTLTKVCQHDTEGFLNSERFHVLLQPLVDQLENEQGAEERRQRRVHGHLVPCLVAFLAAAGDDSLWKPANHQLLLKTRHQSPQVRLDAVASLSAVHARLGDDYLALLPETMPFLAELLEDDEPRVEAATQALIGQMEATLGESLQQYF